LREEYLKTMAKDFSQKGLSDAVAQEILEEMDFIFSEEEINAVLEKQLHYDEGL
jgi:hypothetical protein